MVDYLWDDCSYYTIVEAAYLWCDMEPEPQPQSGPLPAKVAAMIRMLLPAFNRSGWNENQNMPSTATELELYQRYYITRQNLRIWAEKNEKRPKFLFPEVRPNQGDNPTQPEIEKKRRSQQISFILDTIDSLHYPRLAIPYGGKTEVKKRCLGYPALFTDSGFYHAWEDASKAGQLGVIDKEKYIK